MNSIPASDIVSILPGVVGTGGNPLSLNAVFITKKQPATMLGVKSFGSKTLLRKLSALILMSIVQLKSTSKALITLPLGLMHFLLHRMLPQLNLRN